MHECTLEIPRATPSPSQRCVQQQALLKRCGVRQVHLVGRSYCMRTSNLVWGMNLQSHWLEALVEAKMCMYGGVHWLCLLLWRRFAAHLPGHGPAVPWQFPKCHLCIPAGQMQKIFLALSHNILPRFANKPKI